MGSEPRVGSQGTSSMCSRNRGASFTVPPPNLYLDFPLLPLFPLDRCDPSAVNECHLKPSNGEGKGESTEDENDDGDAPSLPPPISLLFSLVVGEEQNSGEEKRGFPSGH